MKYGKIRIEDGNFIFSKHMMMNYLPCKDIIWAYKRKEGVEGGAQKQYSTSSLVIITRRKKRYQFESSDGNRVSSGKPDSDAKSSEYQRSWCIRNRGWQTYSAETPSS